MSLKIVIIDSYDSESRLYDEFKNTFYDLQDVNDYVELD